MNKIQRNKNFPAFPPSNPRDCDSQEAKANVNHGPKMYKQGDAVRDIPCWASPALPAAGSLKLLLVPTPIYLSVTNSKHWLLLRRFITLLQPICARRQKVLPKIEENTNHVQVKKEPTQWVIRQLLMKPICCYINQDQSLNTSEGWTCKWVTLCRALWN